jgi:nucleoside-diphosphate-sugar epimerase
MEVLKDARVLVTGSDGFIGSHVVEQLVQAGANVKAVVYYNSFNSWGWLDTFPADIMKSVEVSLERIVSTFSTLSASLNSGASAPRFSM